MIRLWKERGKNGWIWRLMLSLPVWYRRFERRGKPALAKIEIREAK